MTSMNLNIRKTTNSNTRYHNKIVTFLSPFKGESSCFHSTVSRNDWCKTSEVHFTIQNERAFWEMAGTPIYTFHQRIGELSQLQSEQPPIKPDKRTQSAWKSWHVPRWWQDGGQGPMAKTNTWHLSAISLSGRFCQIGSHSLQIPTGHLTSFKSRGQVERTPSLFVFIVSICFLISSPSSSPPSVCLVSPSVRLVSLHAGRQPVSLSSF